MCESADVQKTSNRIEGWHRSFNALVGCKKPAMYIYINSIKKFQGETNFYADNFLKDQFSNKRKRCEEFVTRNEKLHDIVKSYSSFENKIAYLEAIAEIYGS